MAIGDGGASWVTTTLGIEDIHVHALALSPAFASDHTLAMGTTRGVLLSTNAGDSWTDISPGLGNLDVLTLAILPGLSPTILAGTNGGGVWRYTVVSPPTPTPTFVATPVGGWPVRGSFPVILKP